MAIICSNCATQLPDDAKFCYKCATPVIVLSEKEQEKRFFEALEKSDMVTVRELLALNRNLATKPENNWPYKTPLHVAVQKGNKALAQLLVEYGANVNAETSSHDTPLDLAYHNNDVNIARFLLENGASPTKIGGAIHALYVLAAKGNRPFVQLLLEHGLDANQPDDYGLTPLHQVSMSDTPNTSVALLLIQKGADVNATDKNLETPLHNAAYHGNLNIVELLLKNGARINAQEKYNKTPLVKAAQGGHIAVVKYLLEQRADPKLSAPIGFAKTYEIRELLRSYGARE